ncbi:MAG TPA: peptidylprolyl isomerase [Candidatus Sulfotelmatobacter sp.]|nr:peptidylprolyl isomerase [Candidatus Sulfotelmatobacter sp.]
MGKSWLMCVLLGAMAWGQAQPGTPPAAKPSQAPAPRGAAGQQAATAPADPAESVPLTAAVLTIKGVCKPKPAAAKAGTAPAKPAAKTAPAECTTVITRAEFEKLANSLSPRVTPQFKKQLATGYPNLLAFAQAAHKEGLDKTARFKTLMEFYRLQVLGNELKREVSEDAAKISDADIESYYQTNLATYQQFNLDRVFVPHFQHEAEAKTETEKDENDKGEKDEKSADQQKVKAQPQPKSTEQDEAKLADTLRTRALAGEDFTKLQKDAYDAAGMKIEVPTINLPSVRRNALPPGQVAVFELKEGEVSQVISDSGGHYIYRVKAIEQMPLNDQLKNEIHNMLQGQKQRAGLDKYQNSYSVVTNEEYFGPPTPAGRPGAPPMRMPPNMKMPTQGAPPAQPPAQPQAQPPAKPN